MVDRGCRFDNGDHVKVGCTSSFLPDSSLWLIAWPERRWPSDIIVSIPEQRKKYSGKLFLIYIFIFMFQLKLVMVTSVPYGITSLYLCLGRELFCNFE